MQYALIFFDVQLILAQMIREPQGVDIDFNVTGIRDNLCAGLGSLASPEPTLVKAKRARPQDDRTRGCLSH